ncbi:hypothetical protein H7F51_17610 [Novosphingobium flavum]|uniref:Uncharacterized protein n=1 Tax=Novosphingobium flavum TaxID=1778672 RepID=A0A7X1FUQ0_9SPHN|nr:hypothetical protein [Novosphingobium flavum]MBC2667339.1 hypothetical protein [Novosphingobium flavum]
MDGRICWMAAAAGLLAGGAGAQSKEERIEPSPDQLRTLNALTPEGVASVVAVEGDDLEPVVVLTTARAWSSKGKFTDRVRSDNFLRAFIGKKTGEARFQLYQQVTYSFQYRNFRQVVFATSQGPRSAPVTELSHEVVTCAAGLCVYKDTLGFDLPESVVREIAAGYQPGASPLWRFRFKAQNGFDWEDRIAPAEAAGLLLAISQRGPKP